MLLCDPNEECSYFRSPSMSRSQGRKLRHHRLHPDSDPPLPEPSRPAAVSRCELAMGQSSTLWLSICPCLDRTIPRWRKRCPSCPDPPRREPFRLLATSP